MALTVFGAATKSPRHLNIERNDDRSDDVTLLALARGWPAGTWRSLTARALYLAGRLYDAVARSNGQLTLVRSSADLEAFAAARRPSPDRRGPAGDRRCPRAGAGPRRPRRDRGRWLPDGRAGALLRQRLCGLGLHGVEKGGLTTLGRELIAQLEARSMIVDVAHASARTIDDVLADRAAADGRIPHGRLRGWPTTRAT